MNRKRLIGILWVLGGLALLIFGFRREPQETVPVLLGAFFVAVGAALIRRSTRRRGNPPVGRGSRP